MAFFSTPEVEWLYSGVTMTNPSNEAIFSAHCRVCSFWYWPIEGGSGSSRCGRAQVDELELGVAAARGDVVDPPGHLLAVAVGAGAAEDDADPGHGNSSCAELLSRGVEGRALILSGLYPGYIPTVE